MQKVAKFLFLGTLLGGIIFILLTISIPETMGAQTVPENLSQANSLIQKLSSLSQEGRMEELRKALQDSGLSDEEISQIMALLEKPTPSGQLDISALKKLFSQFSLPPSSNFSSQGNTLRRPIELGQEIQQLYADQFQRIIKDSLRSPSSLSKNFASFKEKMLQGIFSLLPRLEKLVRTAFPTDKVGDLFQAPPVNVHFLVDWKANSVAPRAYQGKILPGPSTKVTASFSIVDGGKVADLSDKEIFWYLDDNLIASGKGIRSVTFRTFLRGATFHRLKIMVDNYSNEGASAIYTIRIPVIFPKVVVEAPFPNNIFSSQKIRLPAKLFYYSKKVLPAILISWEVNGKRTSMTNPKSQVFLDIDMGNTRKKKNVSIFVRSENISELVKLTSANTSLNLVYQPK